MILVRGVPHDRVQFLSIYVSTEFVLRFVEKLYCMDSLLLLLQQNIRSMQADLVGILSANVCCDGLHAHYVCRKCIEKYHKKN